MKPTIENIVRLATAAGMSYGQYVSIYLRDERQHTPVEDDTDTVVCKRCGETFKRDPAHWLRRICADCRKADQRYD